MPLRFGNNGNQAAIYKGSVPFSKAYLADKLVWSKGGGGDLSDLYGVTTAYLTGTSKPSYTTDGFKTITSFTNLPDDDYGYCDISEDGKTIVFASNTQRDLYISIDYGETWIYKYVTANYGYWPSFIKVSGDGSAIAYSIYGQGIWLSKDYGAAFNLVLAGTYWSIDMSHDGQYIVVFTGSTLYISNDYGSTWFTYIADSSLTAPNAMSTNGQYIYALSNIEHVLYKSDDYGNTFRKILYGDYDPNYEGGVVCNNTGKYVWIGSYSTSPHNMKYSTDYGETWSVAKSIPSTFISRGFITSSGNFMGYSNRISWDEGNTWVTIPDSLIGTRWGTTISNTLYADLPDLGGQPRVPFITEWQMTAGVFAIVNKIDKGTFDCYVDWGDGSPETHITSYNDVGWSHTYASAGTYQISIEGVCSNVMATSSFTSANRLKLTKVIQWGDLQWTTMEYMFYNCTNLMELPNGPIEYAEYVTSMYNTFYNCKFTTIPVGFFDNLISVTEFRSAFQNSSITEFPSDLFKYCTQANSFYTTFSGSKITAIPDNFFQYCINITSYYNSFSSCSLLATIGIDIFKYGVNIDNLNGIFSICNNVALTTVPTGIFDYLVNATSFASVFDRATYIITYDVDMLKYNTNVLSLSSFFKQTHVDCKAHMFDYNTEVTTLDNFFINALVVTIPPDLFKFNTKVLSFANTFAGNNSTDSIQDLFKYNTSASNFTSTLTGYPGTTIPNDLLYYQTSITSVQSLFQGCSNITTIPNGLFDNVVGTAYYTFSSTFSGCSSLVNIPSTIFPYTPSSQQRTFLSTFSNCTSLTLIPAGLFDNATNLTSDVFNTCFSWCTSIETVPTDLFKYATAVTDAFNGTFNICRALTTVPSGLFDYNVNVTDFSSLFSSCDALTIVPDHLFDYNILTTNMAQVFFNCGITTVPVGLFDYLTSVTSYSGLFQSSDSLTSIPTGLFNNSPMNVTFASAFSSCDALENLPANLFRYSGTNFTSVVNSSNKVQVPSNLFYEPGEESTRFAGLAVNFSTAFYYLNIFTGVQGTAPNLWNCTYGSVTTTNCFKYSDQAFDNWASIPIAWGGPA